MISIFNGRSRSLGEGERKEVYLKVHVAFRRYLHLFRGASLAVFQAIALHSDEQGWSWPTVATIHRETGYKDDAIYSALNKLETIEIKGRRVLLRTKTPPPHFTAPDDGNYARNFYLIFPSSEELRKYAEDASGKRKNQGGSNKENHLGKTGYGFTGPEKPGTENPDTVFPGIKKNHGSQAEPSGKEKPHTQPESGAQPALFAGEPGGNRPEAGVCVSAGKFSDKQYQRYIDECIKRGEPVESPAGLLIYLRKGEMDARVAQVLRDAESAVRPTAQCDSTCHICFGSQFEVVPGKGMKGRCPNSVAAKVAETSS